MGESSDMDVAKARAEEPRDVSANILGNETDALIDHNEAEKESKSDIRKRFVGYACITIGMIGVCIGLMFAQLLNRLIPHSELNALRYAVQVTIAVVIVGASKDKQVRVERRKVGWLILVSLCVLTGSYTSYGATYYLPIGLACAVQRCLETLIYFIVTLVIARSVRIEQVAALCLCVIGALLVAQPPLIFNNTGHSLVNSSAAPHSPCNLPPTNASFDGPAGENHTSIIGSWNSKRDTMIGYSLVLLEAPTAAVGTLVIRYKLNDLDTKITVFWMSVIGILVSIFLMLATEVPTLPHLLVCAMFLAGHMLISGSHNFFLMFGYKYSPPFMTGLLKMIQIPGTFLLQYTVLSGMYPGHANVFEIAGAAVVFAGNVLMPLSEAVKYYRGKRTEPG